MGGEFGGGHGKDIIARRRWCQTLQTLHSDPRPLEEKMGVTRNELKRAVSRYFAIWVEDTLRYVYRSEGGWVSPEKLTEAQLHWWEYIDKQYVPLVVYDALPVVPAKPQ